MRIDKPLCGFKYCRCWRDYNCIGNETIRERCEYLQMLEKEEEIEKLYDSIKETYRIIEEMRNE